MKIINISYINRVPRTHLDTRLHWVYMVFLLLIYIILVKIYLRNILVAADNDGDEVPPDSADRLWVQGRLRDVWAPARFEWVACLRKWEHMLRGLPPGVAEGGIYRVLCPQR